MQNKSKSEISNYTSSRMKNKKGQVTIFVILGIVIVVGIALVLIFSDILNLFKFVIKTGKRVATKNDATSFRYRESAHLGQQSRQERELSKPARLAYAPKMAATRAIRMDTL